MLAGLGLASNAEDKPQPPGAFCCSAGSGATDTKSAPLAVASGALSSSVPP